LFNPFGAVFVAYSWPWVAPTVIEIKLLQSLGETNIESEKVLSVSLFNPFGAVFVAYSLPWVAPTVIEIKLFQS
jgi:hypothetical protein